MTWNVNVAFLLKTISKIYIQIRKKEMFSWRRHKANEIKYQNKIKLQDITTWGLTISTIKGIHVRMCKIVEIWQQVKNEKKNIHQGDGGN